ncbi:MAG TPA: methyltransferase domain-containing protein [Candidatus Polarisedimenticolaceae bacterium]|nr:methyltransferase domain-containing protein [Candidatus Polarisedimenticolaceae bacterium]
MATTNRQEIHEAVRKAYGEVARTRNLGGEETAEACCRTDGPSSDYTPAELAAVPAGAYLGEGSGAPVRHAALASGETVVDLGSGAGMDSFLAVAAVGPTGRVHGFDLTRDMLERARGLAASAGHANVSFEAADIEHLPLPSGSADAAISNCVINLSPDKRAVYREIFRVLRPGGRLSIADIVLRGESAALHALRDGADAASWCACLSGALPEDDYLQAIRSAGFEQVRIVAERPAQTQPENGVRAVAVTVTARKP